METTAAFLRRQGRLLLSLLDLPGDRETALVLFEQHLQRRIELVRKSVLPWLERRIGHLSALEDLRAQERQIFELLASRRLTQLRTVVESYLREQEQVIAPLIEFRA